MSNTEWTQVDKVEGDTLHYKSCGLDNIYLGGGFMRHQTRYGNGVSIDDIEGLHRAIGRTLVAEDRPLTGKEIRFLRKEMKYTQERLAELVKVSDQAVARWEKGENEIPGSAEIVIRALYRQHIGDSVNVRKMAEQFVRSMAKKATGPQIFEPTSSGWHAHAA
jgi:putative transcriptional regulator